MKFHLFPKHDPTAPHRLILLFAGWGMDERPFEDVGVPGYELCVLWDYRNDTFPAGLEAKFGDYAEIVVVAWSFGVPAATRFIASHRSLPVTARISVNGTMHPVDDGKGIPADIFNGTLDGLTVKTLSKFYLRMCGGGETFRRFSERLPKRSVGELRDELSAIAALPVFAPAGLWDRAVIGAKDRIIPADNQRQAWISEAFETIETDSPHLPDFNALLRRMITEKRLVASKFSRARETYSSNAVVQQNISEKLVRKVNEVVGDRTAVRDVLEIGCGTGLTTRLLAGVSGIDAIEAWDLHISPSFGPIEGAAVTKRECDAETAIRQLPDASVDLIVSASTMQWFNSPATFLRECGRVLRPGGSAVISTFGPETMRELTSSLSVRRHYPEVEAYSRMIPRGCALRKLSSETIGMTFPSASDALRHVRLTGVNALSSAANGPSAVRELLANYPLDPDGNAVLTYQPVYIVISKE